MENTSIGPYFILSALFIGIASLIVRWSSFYRRKLMGASGGRFMAIDGLRGFLSLGVFFHHAVINYFYRFDQVWKTPNSQFYTMCGQVGVSFFFIITAFLFWAKVLAAEGNINWRRLYLSRISRIVPMYIVSVILLLLMVLIQSHWLIKSSVAELARDGFKWFAFSFLGSPDVNQLKNTFTINAGVFWTLAYEWKYYFMLPFITIFFQQKKQLIFYIIATVFTLISADSVLLYFLAGMIAAQIHHKRSRLIERFSSHIYDLIFMGAVITLFVGFQSAYGLMQALIATLGFICLLNGNGLFGLLHMKSIRLLGEISYSIYLLHGFVITASIYFSKKYIDVMSMGDNYWIMVAVMGCLLILLSSLTYRWFECQFMMQSRTDQSKNIEVCIVH